MESKGLCEQEYALFAMDKFLKRQRRFRKPLWIGNGARREW